MRIMSWCLTPPVYSDAAFYLASIGGVRLPHPLEIQATTLSPPVLAYQMSKVFPAIQPLLLIPIP